MTVKRLLMTIKALIYINIKRKFKNSINSSCQVSNQVYIPSESFWNLSTSLFTNHSFYIFKPNYLKKKCIKVLQKKPSKTLINNSKK